MRCCRNTIHSFKTNEQVFKPSFQSPYNLRIKSQTRFQSYPKNGLITALLNQQNSSKIINWEQPFFMYSARQYADMINKKYLKEPELANVDPQSPEQLATALGELSLKYRSDGNLHEASKILHEALQVGEEYFQTHQNKQDACVLKARLQLRNISIMLDLNENVDKIYSKLCQLNATCENAPQPEHISIIRVVLPLIDFLVSMSFSYFNNLPLDQFIRSKMKLLLEAFQDEQQHQLVAKCLLGVSQTINNDQVKQGMETMSQVIEESRSLMEKDYRSFVDTHIELLERVSNALNRAVKITPDEKLIPKLYHSYMQHKRERLDLLQEGNKLASKELAQSYDVLGFEFLQDENFTSAFESLKTAIDFYRQYSENCNGQIDRPLSVRQGFCTVGMGYASLCQFEKVARSPPQEMIQEGETNPEKQRTLELLMQTEEYLQQYLHAYQDIQHQYSSYHDLTNGAIDLHILNAWVHSLLGQLYDKPERYESAAEHHQEAYQQSANLSKHMKQASAQQNVLFRSVLHQMLIGYARHFDQQSEQDNGAKFWSRVRNNAQDLIKLLDRLQQNSKSYTNTSNTNINTSNNNNTNILNLGETEFLTFVVLNIPINKEHAARVLNSNFYVNNSDSN